MAKAEELEALNRRKELTKVVSSFQVSTIENSVVSTTQIDVPLRNFSIGLFSKRTERAPGHTFMVRSVYTNFFFWSFFKFADIEYIRYSKDNKVVVIKLKSAYRYEENMASELYYNLLRFEIVDRPRNLHVSSYFRGDVKDNDLLVSSRFYDEEELKYSLEDFDEFIAALAELNEGTYIGDYWALTLSGEFIGSFDRRMMFIK